ncbi:hypothetical protein FB009_10487 [Sinorhizobium medicae]|nr:hypothetical protein FB009_10487 [Sinorhizobium medicae]
MCGFPPPSRVSILWNGGLLGRGHVQYSDGRGRILSLGTEPALVQFCDKSFAFQRRDDVVHFGCKRGAPLLNMIEYFSPVGMRSTTFRSGLSFT